MPLSFSSPVSRDGRLRGVGVTAVLGPTNTGKTHLAIERMLGHSSGMIGLPLRLLAREVYSKVAARVGEENVALITGEEKIKPPNPRFWVCTVEAMPQDLDVAFVAIDEIQLGADFERGHVFTDRILNRRGREETLVLGAATMRPMVERLLHGANIVQRPRLSQLTFAGDRKITRLPRRSAVVAFSANEVYAIAELIRRQRGGAAVVLGALSPRTRNAQVEIYQSGDVDHLVATDAIGMGLNLDVDHVAFAADSKFDGHQFRRLNPSELAQIAGRAGRATRDGTFGTTGRCPPFDDELVRALESHSFEPVKMLQWRNSELDFASLGALQASLAQTPPTDIGLTRAPVGEDILVLEHAARDDAIRALASTPDAVRRLWEVCQVPDYRRISPATHAELVAALYGFLARDGRIDTDWFSRHVAQADRSDGDIDTLSSRIAHVRTWTFVANRPDWLADPEHWQDVTRSIEDKLSDALHERLTERFVDRRTSVLMRRLRENTSLETQVQKSGEVVVEGHEIGRLDGFTFAPDASAGGSEAKALQAAARSVLASEIDARATKVAQAPERDFVLSSDGVLRWVGAPVGRLIPGDDVMRPRVRVIADDQLTGASREAVQTRLDLWVKAHVERLLQPLFALSAAEDITGIARGIAFQLVEALGVLDRQKVADDVKGLDQPSRATLRKYGVRFGAYHLYIPALLKPAPRGLATQLWALKHESPDLPGLDDLQRLASSGRTSIPVDPATPKELYRTTGYRVCGERAIRVDILERLADLIRPALAWRQGVLGPRPEGAFDGFGFTVSGAMTSLTGASGEDFASILRSLGYRMEKRPKPPEPKLTESERPETKAPESEAATPAEPGSAIEPAETTQAETASAIEPAATASLDATDEGAEAGAAETATETAPDEPSDSLEAAAVPTFEAPPAEEADTPAAEAEQAAAVSEAASETEPSVEATGNDAEADTPPTDEAESPTGETAPATESAPSEPEMIEVWRPGRPAGQGRRHEGSRRSGGPRRGSRPAQTQNGAAQNEPGQAAATAPESQPGSDAPEDRRQDRRDRPRRQHGKGGDDRTEGGQRSDRPGHQGRPPRRDHDRRDGNRAGKRDGKHDANRPARTWASAGNDKRGKEPDPNSPFAKLQALKEQLEGNK